jgi:hypothetical protein
VGADPAHAAGLLTMLFAHSVTLCALFVANANSSFSATAAVNVFQG